MTYSKNIILVLGLLVLAAINVRFIELIFLNNLWMNILGIFLASLIFPVFFHFAERREKLENYVLKEHLSYDDLYKILSDTLQFWPSFILVLVAGWAVNKFGFLQEFLGSIEIESGFVGLNYALILIIVIFYFRREFGRKQLESILD